VFQDPKVDLVVIGTRHDLHADLALASLYAGKHTFVEKPLALSGDELDRIAAFFGQTETPPLLMVGFNRRFAPLIDSVKAELAGRNGPIVAIYTMNAGFLPPDHWVHGPEGGGRNIGEACHIYDLFNCLCDGARETAISATPLGNRGQRHRKNENFVATIRYDDGSVCSLTYTSLGAKTYPKENLQIFCDGKVITLEDYKTVTVFGDRVRTKSIRAVDKGQFSELKALSEGLRRGAAWPISLDHQLRATRTSFEVERQLLNF
jgi:predicted dehydrogenase